MKFEVTLFKKLIFLIFILSFSLKLNSQQKVYFKQEIGKFEENEKFYIGKKVKNILKDLKINFETAIFGGGWSEESNFIVLKFNNENDYNSLQKKEIDPARITLFIKEHDPKTNKLFYSEKRKIIFRDSLKNESNLQILNAYKNLTIVSIEANSQQPKTKTILK